MIIYSVCLSLSFFTEHDAPQVMQMAKFHSFFYGWLIFVCVCVCVHHIFFIHSSAGGHLGCFHILAILISAAVNRKSHFSQASLLQPGNPLRWCWILIQSWKGFLHHLQCVPPPVSSETSCSPTRPPLFLFLTFLFPPVRVEPENVSLLL